MKDLTKMDLVMYQKNKKPLCVITFDIKHNCTKVIVTNRNLNKIRPTIQKHFGTRLLFCLVSNHIEFENEINRMNLKMDALSEIKFLEDDQITIC